MSTGSCPTILLDKRHRNSIDELLSMKHHRDDDLLNIKVRQFVYLSHIYMYAVVSRYDDVLVPLLHVLNTVFNSNFALPFLSNAYNSFY